MAHNSKRGFANLSPEARRDIARKGGKAHRRTRRQSSSGSG
jgi:hypothetical protein